MTTIDLSTNTTPDTIDIEDVTVWNVQDLATGDIVVTDSGHHYTNHYETGRITKVTKTQITLTNGDRYSRKTCNKFRAAGEFTSLTSRGRHIIGRVPQN